MAGPLPAPRPWRPHEPGPVPAIWGYGPDDAVVAASEEVGRGRDRIG